MGVSEDMVTDCSAAADSHIQVFCLFALRVDTACDPYALGCSHIESRASIATTRVQLQDVDDRAYCNDWYPGSIEQKFTGCESGTNTGASESSMRKAHRPLHWKSMCYCYRGIVVGTSAIAESQGCQC